MADPVSSQQAVSIAQQAFASGLKTLLQTGAQQGRVLSTQPGGKAVISFGAKPFLIDVQGKPLQPGQEVTARLVGERILIQPQAAQADASLQSAGTGVKSLASVLSNLGISGANAQVIAQAFAQAGIPLDRTALKALTQALPNITEGDIAALTFLLARGLPLSDTIIAFLGRLLAPKGKLSETTEKTLNSLKKLEDKLEDQEEEDTILPLETRRRFGQFREELERRLLSFQNHSNEEFQEEIEDFLRSLLNSPEALLLKGGKQSFGEWIVRLLTFLHEIAPLLEGTHHASLLSQLIDQTTQLHESLSGQALLNLPALEQDQGAVFYFQAPYRDGEDTRNLEIRYQPGDEEANTGSIDFLLEMTRLGPMKIALQWNKPNLSLSILTQEEAVADYLKTGSDELQKALQSLGFHVESIGVHTGMVPDSLAPKMDSISPQMITGFDIFV